MNAGYGLLGAMQFLTRIPVRVRVAVPHDRVVPWFPAVGALVGVVVGGAAAVAATTLPPTVAAALAVTLGLLVTGAFHEDGLADTADAFGGGWSREERLDILKDTHHGTYGVAAIVASIVIRIAALASLPTGATMVAGAVVAHMLGRAAAVAALGVFPPALESGLGADSRRDFAPVPALGAVAGTLVLTAVALGWWAVACTVTAMVATAAVGLLAVRKIGGIAGDVLGAIEQVAEIAVLTTVAALAGASTLWWA